MTKIILSFLILFISTISFASIPDVGGIYWRQMNLQEKEYYISGLMDGATIYESKIKKDTSNFQALTYFPNINFDDMIIALDKFFKNDDNVNLKIDTALHAIKMEISGENKKDIENYLTTERKAAETVINQIKNGEIQGATWNESKLNEKQIRENYIEETIPTPGGITFTVLVDKSTDKVIYYWDPSGSWISATKSQINFQNLYDTRRTLRMLPPVNDF